jgi:hypothetical protein
MISRFVESIAEYIGMLRIKVIDVTNPLSREQAERVSTKKDPGYVDHLLE